MTKGFPSYSIKAQLKMQTKDSSGWHFSNVYFDNGYGFNGYADVDISKKGITRVEGMTQKQIDAKSEKIIRKLTKEVHKIRKVEDPKNLLHDVDSRDIVGEAVSYEGIIRYSLSESAKEILQRILDTLSADNFDDINDFTTLDMYSGLIDSYGSYSYDDLDEMVRENA